MIAICAVSYSAIESKKKDCELNAIAIANIEALSLGEQQKIPVPCHSSGEFDSKKRYTDCSTCSPVVGYKGIGTEGLCISN